MTTESQPPPPPPVSWPAPPVGPPVVALPIGSEFLPPAGTWTPRPRERHPLWILGGVIVAVVALFAGLVGVGVFDSRHSYPSKWDARLGDLPATVERLRGLQFVHAVPVRFLDEAAFKKEVGVDPKPSAKARRSMQRLTSQLRAAGLIAGEVDLLKAINSEQQSSVLAFYSPDTKEVVVRGTGVPDAAHRVTLAHELTHVLQDQHFDLNAMEARVGRDPESAPEALRAFVEGDADRIENKYLRSLSASDRAEYRRGRDKEAATAKTGSADVPAIVTLQFSAPYRYGPPVVDVVAADGGNANVDRAFRRGVFTQQLFIEPSAPLIESKPHRVADPALRKGEKADGKAEGFGAFDLYLTLGSRIDPGVALGSAVDWVGGRARLYRADGRTCMRSVVRAARTATAEAMTANFKLWAAALPSGMATVAQRGSSVEVSSCDLGAKSALTSPDTRIEHAGSLLDLHSEIEASVTKEAAQAGAPESTARCFALTIAQSPQVAALIQSPDGLNNSTAGSDAIRAAAKDAQSKCIVQ